MKSQAILLAVLVGGIAVATQAQPTEPPANNPPPTQESAPPADAQPQAAPASPQPAAPPAEAQPATPPVQEQQAQPPVDNPPPADASNAGPVVQKASVVSTVTRPRSGTAVTLVPPKANAGAKGDKSLRMNFRNAPLDQVLNYMSDAAGYIIILETELRGTVDVWSNQPLTQNEAVTLLNTVLNKNGYAVIQDGRFLTVVNKEDARRRDNPINVGNNPTDIPKEARIVTQILPVRSLNATQLVKDLAPLMPTDTTIVANEAGNSLIMTDTQINIRRMAEIIKALDSVSSTINSIRVFPLVYADSKTMVTVIKELFPAPDTASSGNNRGGNRGGGGFPGFFPGMGGPGGGGNSSGGSSAQKASTRVLVVADDNSNSVIVSAPDDVLPVIEQLVSSMDVSVDEEAQTKVFKLLYSDPTEMSTLLSSLFPDDTTSNNNNNNRFGGGGPFGGMFGQQRQNNNSGTSDRAKRKARVLAVPDARTASLVVSADKNLMPHIAEIIQQLDSNPAKKMKVYSFALQNADVQDVQQVLNDLFQSSTSRNSRNSSSSQTSPLSTRATTMQQLQTQNTSTSLSTQSSGRGN